ncbi:primosomal replication protein PriB/PriC domain protein, partial [Salmonella enterica]|nr:primosomal replication protein PriB/PriC domain protein [Salmonella enterica]
KEIEDRLRLMDCDRQIHSLARFT